MTTGARARAVIAAVALALTASQVLEAMSFASGPWLQRYHQLLQWDGGWYVTIVEGYHSTVPLVKERPDLANVAFFPGYPITARMVGLLTGWSPETALLATAQLAAWLFWTYVLALCRRWGLTPGGMAGVVGVIAVHPAAFFLVVGYAESLFLAMLLGFVFWSARPSRAAAVTAAAHGFVMTATRIIGIGCAAYPLIHAGRSWVSVKRSLVLSGIAGLGAATFFVYCQWKFGAWDLYMQMARLAWNDSWSSGALVNPAWYRVTHRQLAAALGGEVDQMNRLAVPVVLWELGAVALMAVLSRQHDDSVRRAGLGLLAVAVLMFVIGVDGRAALWMSGMLRYTFAMHVCAVLAAVALVRAAPGRRRLRTVLWVTAALVGLASLHVQLGLVERFVGGKWVA